MAMPEAAVHENYRAPASQDDIGLARQAGGMEAVAKATPVQSVPDGDYRAGVGATNARHHPAPDGGFDNVGHRRGKRSCAMPPVYSPTPIQGATWRATACTTGTTTALPNCL